MSTTRLGSYKGQPASLVLIEEFYGKSKGLYQYVCNCGEQFFTMVYAISHCEKKHVGGSVKELIRATELTTERQDLMAIYDACSENILQQFEKQKQDMLRAVVMKHRKELADQKAKLRLEFEEKLSEVKPTPVTTQKQAPKAINDAYTETIPLDFEKQKQELLQAEFLKHKQELADQETRLRLEFEEKLREVKASCSPVPSSSKNSLSVTPIYCRKSSHSVTVSPAKRPSPNIMVSEIMTKSSKLNGNPSTSRNDIEMNGLPEITSTIGGNISAHFVVEGLLGECEKDDCEKVKEEQSASKDNTSKKKKKAKKTWEYVPKDEKPNRKDLTIPRELDESDEFFGRVAGAVKGETKKLFDPTHKNTASELLLAQLATNGRITRRQMKDILPVEPSGTTPKPCNSKPSSSKVHLRTSNRKSTVTASASAAEKITINSKSSSTSAESVSMKSSTESISSMSCSETTSSCSSSSNHSSHSYVSSYSDSQFNRGLATVNKILLSTNLNLLLRGQRDQLPPEPNTHHQFDDLVPIPMDIDDSWTEEPDDN